MRAVLASALTALVLTGGGLAFSGDYVEEGPQTCAVADMNASTVTIVRSGIGTQTIRFVARADGSFAFNAPAPRFVHALVRRDTFPLRRACR